MKRHGIAERVRLAEWIASNLDVEAEIEREWLGWRMPSLRCARVSGGAATIHPAALEELAEAADTGSAGADLGNNPMSVEGLTDSAPPPRPYEVAAEAHAGQRRASGAEYVLHTVEVATLLATLRLDSASIISGLIHDTVENTALSLEDVEVRARTHGSLRG
ncbi:MAG: HD domain-containing protein [Longimicrobiales bacterium]|nr:HD domain-containing protein [Longimicrobiales bacterium]